MDRFNFANEHKRLEVTLKMKKTGGEIGYTVRACGGTDFGTKYIRVPDVILMGGDLATFRTYRKFSAFL
jgi:hypothetical protein